MVCHSIRPVVCAHHPELGWHQTDSPERIQSDRDTYGVATDPNHRVKGPIIFAVATRPERRACSAAIEESTGHDCEYAHFLQTGYGPLQMERLVEQVARLHPSGLISIGTAGGLAPKIARGTLLIPKRILRTSGGVMKTDPGWRSHVCGALVPHIRVDTGDLLSVTELIRHPAQKRALHSETEAIGVDMESGQLAQLAAQIGIPFLALRVVMDAADDEIPGAAKAALTKQGDTAVGPLFAYLLTHPGDLPGIFRTARRFRHAAGSLRSACRLGHSALLRSC